MTWASHPTTEMPTARRRRPWITAIALLAVAGGLTAAGFAFAPRAPSPTAAGAASDPTASPLTSPTPAPSPTVIDLRVLEDETLALVNAVRVQHNCPELRTDPALVAVARAHSDVMARTGQYSHIAPDGKDPAARMEAAGYPIDLGWAESIARHQTTPAEVIDQWLGNEANRAILLDCAMLATGVGVARAGDGALYWTQDFGGR